MLVNISGGGIQRPLHHAGLWEPTGGVGEKAWLCALPSTRGRQKGRVILGPFWMVGHGLVDQVTGDVDDVSTFMVDLQGGGAQLYKNKAQRLCNGDGGTGATYHGGEQQSHEDGPRDQEEDDEDADDFIQRSLQPDNDLREGGGWK